VYVITDPCIDVKDKSCIEVCPVDCIHTEDDDRICYIDPDACTGCNQCLPACPVGAIFTEDTLPVAAKEFGEINALWFHDATTARAKVNERADG
jgi:NAD-dependent dihydropyrimidine dehydrogenase PreA subunit